ncbi:class II glutamine amidotransferase [Methylomarinum vadi]|uniref:class II glutamine amidotransferase n=1 Tax=Methylomarinum vadi TaxID=438855 RepID=UPI00055ED369|nr:class II glutamine amidotransferase [Methylomarinum vadi]
MCELFALSSRIPTTVGFTLERLARRGGIEGPHRDGWGVAFYEGADVFLLREPRAAAQSDLVRYIERHAPPSQLVVSHIRRATRGEPALRNTQPFVRELGGYTHVFAHNGELGGIERRRDFLPGRFRPVGDTDSELVFCSLLDRLDDLWTAAGGCLPPLPERLEVVAAFAGELREFGPANFLYADGDALFAHAHRRIQADGHEGPPGLHLLERSGEEPPADLATSGVTLTSVRQEAVLLASVPLTDEPWQPLPEGEVVVVMNGAVVARAPCFGSKVIHSIETTRE